MSKHFRWQFIGLQLCARREGEKYEERARKKAEQRADEVTEKLWEIIEQTNREGNSYTEIPRELDFDDALFKLLHKSFYADGVTLLEPNPQDYGDKYKMSWRERLPVQDDE